MYNFISIEEKNSFYKKQKWFLFLKYKISWMDNNETSLPSPKTHESIRNYFQLLSPLTDSTFKLDTSPHHILSSPSIHSISTHRVPASCAHPQCVVTRLACHDSTRRGLLEYRAFKAESRRERWNEWILNGESSETVSSER